MFNLSGELTFIVVFFAATIFLKVGGAVMKFEKLRTISSKLRGIWNAILFCLMPRILTFSSFSLRDFDDLGSKNLNIASLILAIVFIIGYLVYFVALLLQIR
jgi:hypothetical protein